jgi:MFS transporter, OFA family, oxalate/formate antiporter
VLFVLCCASSLFLQNPRSDYVPDGWEPATRKLAAEVRHWTPSETVRSGSFWLLWLQFLFSAMSGLMVIGNYKSYGMDIDTDFASDNAAVVGKRWHQSSPAC